jgi:hypothetical protein
VEHDLWSPPNLNDVVIDALTIPPAETLVARRDGVTINRLSE